MPRCDNWTVYVFFCMINDEPTAAAALFTALAAAARAPGEMPQKRQRTPRDPQRKSGVSIRGRKQLVQAMTGDGNS